MTLDIVTLPRPDDAPQARLLRRARREAPADARPWAWVLGRLGLVPDDAPLAALCALGEGLPAGRWMRADPVALVPNRDHLVMAGNAHLGLAAEEAEALARHLAQWDLAPGLARPHPRRWYWPLEDEAGVRAPPWGEVLGRDIRPALPRGPAARVWRARLAEWEMALYQSPVNEARRAQGRPTVDSLWLWGAGDLPEAPGAPWRWVAGEGPLARGLAAWLGLPHAPLDRLPEGVGLILLDEGLEGPPEGPAPLDWEILAARLRRGDWPALRVVRAGEGVFTVRAPPRWAFWRR